MPVATLAGGFNGAYCDPASREIKLRHYPLTGLKREAPPRSVRWMSVGTVVGRWQLNGYKDLAIWPPDVDRGSGAVAIPEEPASLSPAADDLERQHDSLFDSMLKNDV